MAQLPTAVDWAIMHEDPSSPSPLPGDIPATSWVSSWKESRDEASSAQEEPLSRGRSIMRGVLEVAAVVGVAAIIALGLRAFVFQVYQIPSESMNDTMQVGSRISVNRIPGVGKDIERGDIIVFRDTEGWLAPLNPDDAGIWSTIAGWIGFAPRSGEQIVVKRVIGVGGDTVECCDAQGRLTVNGVAIDEPYLPPDTLPSETSFSVVIPSGTYWVMGDNRQNSADSRYHMGSDSTPFIPQESVIGRAQWEIWPPSRLGYLGNRDVFEAVPDTDAS